ncbi:uncharacterized protein LOC131075943 [Cryptomeria japonica]|uniref:uncharacterized protein LOC131075943 n=1 Tax=Cryptomeria japonica TaxID=3369 RepID=UPI0027D9D73E|nr:uncharacterized protein LOC131075943 [Cryptomeria japonica]
MECNKEEALRAKEIAEKKFEVQDFISARKLIVKAQQLYPALENVPQMLAVCDVHCVAQTKLNGCDMDWYGILQVESTADDSVIKKQYRKLALLLHPDKNKFCGAEAAFKLIGEAMGVLSDTMKRTLHDIKRRATVNGNNIQSKGSRFQTAVRNSSNGNVGMQQPNATQARMQAQPNTDATFWTICPFCTVKYQYLRTVENKYLLCQNCHRPFVAKDLAGGSGVNMGYTWNASSIPQQQEFSKQGANFKGPGSVPFAGFTRDCNNGNQEFATNKASQGGVNRSGKATNIPDDPQEKAKEEAAHKQQMQEKARMAAEADAARRKMKEEEKEQKRREKEAEKKAKAEAKAREALRKIETQRKAKAEKGTGNEKTRKRLRKVKNSGSDSDENADVTLEDNLSDEQTAPRGEGEFYSRRRSARSKRNVTYRVDGSDDEDFVDFPPSKRPRDVKEGADESVKVSAASSGDNGSQNGKLQAESDKSKKQNMSQKDKKNMGQKDSQTMGQKDKQNLGQKDKQNLGQKDKQTPRGKVSDESQDTKDEKHNQKNKVEKIKEEKTEEKAEEKTEEKTEKPMKETVHLDSNKGIHLNKIGNKTVRNKDTEIISPESPCEKPDASSSLGLETFDVPDADFHDFDSARTEKDISDGQIWAAYDNIDGMPRFYLRINKVISMNPFKCRISWLESCPFSQEQLDWEEENLPVACGMFKRAKSDVMEGVNTFSHVMQWEKCVKKGAVNLFPRRGDIWAVYKKWHIGWKNPENGSPKFEYEMVEVLTDFSEEIGVEVVLLVKVGGFKTIFKRQKVQGVERRMKISPKELLKFSHQVPAHRMNGSEGTGVPKGGWELDPASMPPELFRIDANKSSA